VRSMGPTRASMMTCHNLPPKLRPCQMDCRVKPARSGGGRAKIRDSFEFSNRRRLHPRNKTARLGRAACISCKHCQPLNGLACDRCIVTPGHTGRQPAPNLNACVSSRTPVRSSPCIAADWALRARSGFAGTSSDRPPWTSWQQTPGSTRPPERSQPQVELSSAWSPP
jgi:hypothetical protein